MASEAKQKNSAPRKSAKAEAASRAEGPSPTAGTGALQAPVTDQPAVDEPAAPDSPADITSPAADHTREPSAEVDGAAESAAAPKAPEAGEQSRVLVLSQPLPADIPAALLEGAVYIVKAKPERGLRRAGRAFTREETRIPYGDLSAGQRAAIEGEPDLVVTIQVSRT
ncbi:hypothetical protein RA307_30420 [Xanthobacteraceae bacterium Astr-EGSB]|uniref:hypothetical protein n=1 Tax=Astrobacterium formosum TaxID=3069710 RepID=UPI0027B2C4AB|nr:hypothetical protein [Xanthobacteraceae bacterium Astr-EGSB]